VAFSLTQDLLAVLSGGLVGLTLGLIGGGGSILAVPLLYYVVGVGTPHRAIGTSAVAVAASAAFGLAGHGRARTVKWRCALVFAAAGIAGAAGGAALGKAMDGQRLLVLFGMVMIVIAAMMLRPRRISGHGEVRLERATAQPLLPLLVAIGAAVGFAAGFFGIGGGFLVVPGLIAATGMPLINAIGSSLVSVTAFGLTTAASYAASGLVDWWIAGLFILGGLGGSFAGIRLARHLHGRGRALAYVFAAIVAGVGVYVVLRGTGIF
jgi:uncharacterized membrane protein YfcA